MTILKQWLTHTVSNSKRQAFKGEFLPAFAVKASLRQEIHKLRLPLKVVILDSKQFITSISYIIICAMLTLVLSILVFILCISPYQLTIALLLSLSCTKGSHQSSVLHNGLKHIHVNKSLQFAFRQSKNVLFQKKFNFVAWNFQ